MYYTTKSTFLILHVHSYRLTYNSTVCLCLMIIKLWNWLLTSQFCTQSARPIGTLPCGFRQLGITSACYVLSYWSTIYFLSVQYPIILCIFVVKIWVEIPNTIPKSHSLSAYVNMLINYDDYDICLFKGVNLSIWQISWTCWISLRFLLQIM